MSVVCVVVRGEMMVRDMRVIVMRLVRIMDVIVVVQDCVVRRSAIIIVDNVAATAAQRMNMVMLKRVREMV